MNNKEMVVINVDSIGMIEVPLIYQDEFVIHPLNLDLSVFSDKNRKNFLNKGKENE